MTEFIVNRLKGAESRDWTASRPTVKKVITTSSLAIAGVVDVLADILGV